MRWAVTVSMAVLVLAVAFPTGATTVLKLPVEDMTRRADLVMRAQVGSVDVRVE